MWQRIPPLGPDCFLTENRYSWTNHDNLARSKKVSSSTVFDLYFFSCHVVILSWTRTTREFFFATLVIKKPYWWFIGYIWNIYLILWNWKHCNVADWNRLWFSPYFLKYQLNHYENITFFKGTVKLFLSNVITKF